MPTQRSFERNIEIDLGLAEVRDCPEEHWTMRALAGASVDLGRLVELLSGRAALARDAAVTGSGLIVERDPYVTDQADGPLGAFSGDFTLGGQWSPFVETAPT
jgi:hypothetical protein